MITECFISVINKMVGIFRTHRIMTGDTCDHLTGMGVQDIRPDRMSEFTLNLVAVDAHIVAVPSQHGQMTAAVRFMAVIAFFHVRMFERTVFISGNSFFVTGCTDQVYARFEQRRSITRMRRMAVQAGIAVMQGQVIAGCQHLLLYVFMTVKTG